MVLNLLKQNCKYGFLPALILIWPFVSNIFLKNNLSYITGKWSTWGTLIIHPLQFILLLLIGIAAFKNKNLPKSLIALSSLILTILGMLLWPNQSTTNLIIFISLVTIIYLPKIKETKTFTIMAITIFSTQSLIAIIQFIFKHSLRLQFLNEPIINNSIKGIAKLPFPQFGTELIRSYGTFDHPNILSGFLSLMLIYFLTSQQISKRKKIILSIIGCTALFTTLSRSIIFLPIILIFYYRKKIKQIWLPLTIIIITLLSVFAVRLASPYTTNSNQERLQQIETFVQPNQNKLLPWEEQPIHNIYLLIFQKYNVASLIIILLITATYYYQEKPKINLGIIFLLLISLTDHFLLTLPIGNYFIVLALLIDHSTNSEHPLPASPQAEPVLMQ